MTFKVQLKSFRECVLQLTQHQFALLVGMGVATINRYENGTEPTSAHAQLLASLVDDPNILLRALAGKEKAFGKSIHERLVRIGENRLAHATLLRVEQLQRKIASPEFTGKREFDLERLVHMVLFFTHIGEWKTKLNKLLFYADFLSFQELGRSISGTRYVRGPYGPIPDHFQQFFAALLENDNLTAREEFSADDRPIEKLVARRPFDRNKFSKRELEILEFVYNHFKDNTAKQVVDLSHEEKLYVEAKDGESLSYLAAGSLNIKFTRPKTGKEQKSLAGAVRDITAAIPQSELEKLPTDGAINHDHYLYGAPKKK